MLRLIQAMRWSWALVALCACALRPAEAVDDGGLDAPAPDGVPFADAHVTDGSRSGMDVADAPSSSDSPVAAADASAVTEAGDPDGLEIGDDSEFSDVAVADAPDEPETGCGDAGVGGGCPSEFRLDWRDEPTPVAQPEVVPLTLAPDGTVYLARSFVNGARRVVHVREVQNSLVVGVDLGGHIVAAVPRVGGLRIFPKGLTSDGGGFYALASYSAGFTLSGLTTPAPPALTTCVLAFDRTGSLRWMLPLGTGVWDDGSVLSLVADGHLVLAGAVVGAVTLGAAPFVDAPSPALVRVDLGADGAVRASHALDELRTTSVHVAINPAGRLATLADVAAGDAGSASGVRLSLWEPDGSLRYAIPSSWGQLALDDEGRAYFTSPDLCTATTRGICIASVDRDGARLWSTRFVPRAFSVYAFDVLGALGATWLTVRGSGLDLVVFREDPDGGEKCIPHVCLNRSVSIFTARVGFDGRALASDADFAQGAFIEGGDRRCGLSFAWEGLSCDSPASPVLVGALTCTRRALPCPSGSDDCDGVCVDRASDPDHCGACGHRCDAMLPHAAGICSAGACAYPTCDVGWASCDGDLSNGCETDLRADPNHCGACGVACPTDQRCDGGRCCAGDACGPGPFASDGHEGSFDPERDTELAPGVHHFTTVHIRAGVTVRSAPGIVLDIRAQGAVQIEGVLDLRGADGVSRPYSETMVAPDSPPGPAPGEAGELSYPEGPFHCVWRTSSPYGLRATSPLLPVAYGAPPATPAYGDECYDAVCTGLGSWDLGRRAGTGSIGLDAFEDLALDRVLAPGSRGGDQRAYVRPSLLLTTTSGGGGGSAVRIASATSIAVQGSVLASGGAPRGSGGAIALYAPSVTVAREARVEAGGAALGRVRIAEPCALRAGGAGDPDAGGRLQHARAPPGTDVPSPPALPLKRGGDAGKSSGGSPVRLPAPPVRWRACDVTAHDLRLRTASPASRNHRGREQPAPFRASWRRSRPAAAVGRRR